MQIGTRWVVLTGLALGLLSGSPAQPADEPFTTVQLDPFLDGEYASDLTFKPDGVPLGPDGQVTVNGVPFRVAPDGPRHRGPTGDEGEGHV